MLGWFPQVPERVKPEQKVKSGQEPISPGDGERAKPRQTWSESPEEIYEIYELLFITWLSEE